MQSFSLCCNAFPFGMNKVSFYNPSSQNAEAFLDLRPPGPLYLPVRTKKRYFVPPAVGQKGHKQENPEAKARAAGIVIKQQYFERPINIACTGSTSVVCSSPQEYVCVRFRRDKSDDLKIIKNCGQNKHNLKPVLTTLSSICLFDRPCLMSLTAGIFDPYIPPEGDARLSTLSKEGLKQRTEQMRQSASSQLA